MSTPIQIAALHTAASTAADMSRATEAVECPSWCERGIEHGAADDQEHWTNEREIHGDRLTASMAMYGDREQLGVRLGEHTTLKPQTEQATSLVAVAAELLSVAPYSRRKQRTTSWSEEAAA